MTARAGGGFWAVDDVKIASLPTLLAMRETKVEPTKCEAPRSAKVRRSN